MSILEVRRIIEMAPYGCLASISEGLPRVRPMAFVMLDDGRLWSSTYAVSGKARELAAEPRVEVCFIDEKKNHVRIEGLVSLQGGEREKARLLELNPKVGRHFNGGSDPMFVHIEVRPRRIRWKEPGFSEYHEVDLPLNGDVG
ncbi:pyridoxamine 5'-phosphate oxidase family protein [bacterium]|nr:pyridoxamine 5'-phosphate oxidase family protein [candidate division CSSED10-310 bacterium]